MKEKSNYSINIYATEIYQEFECDTFFPNIDNDVFGLTFVSEFKQENGIHFRHKIYKTLSSISEEEL